MALQVWLPLNGTLENQGLSNVTVTNNGATVDNNGKIGKCYSFDGINDVIEIPNFNIGNNWSYGCWFNSPSSTRSWEAVILLNNNSGDADTQLGFYTYPSASRIQSTANGQYNSNISFASDGKWHHFFATFDSTTLKTYLDGTLVNTKSITASLLQKTNLVIGGRKTSSGYGTYFSGKINDVRIYDHALSPKEVKEIAQGLVLHYKLNGSCGASDNLLLNTQAERTQTRSSSNTFLDYAFQSNLTSMTNTNWVFSFDGKSDSTTIKVDFYFRNSDGSAYAATAYQALTSEYKHYSLPFTGDAANCKICRLQINTGTGTIYIKNVKLEAGSIATPWTPNLADIGITGLVEYDCSGYKNDGTISGIIETRTSSPRYLAATYFNGTNAKIKLPVIQYGGFSNSYTFSWWQYNVSTGNMPWGFSDGNRINFYHYSPCCWNTGDGSSNPFQDGTTTIAPATLQNAWHHMVVTGDGTAVKLYIDGIYRGTAKTYKSLTGTQLWISGWDSGTSYTFNGSKEVDFRIYATAFSAADVLELYNTSMIVDSAGNVHARELIE